MSVRQQAVYGSCIQLRRCFRVVFLDLLDEIVISHAWNAYAWKYESADAARSQ